MVTLAIVVSIEFSPTTRTLMKRNEMVVFFNLGVLMVDFLLVLILKVILLVVLT